MRVKPLDWKRGTFEVSTDPRRLDVDVIHGFLSTSYWARGIPRDVVERSIQGSLCFGFDSPSDPKTSMEIVDGNVYAGFTEEVRRS